MKASLVILCLVSVIGFMVLAPLVMAHGAEHGGHCPIAMLNGETCLTISSFLGHLRIISDILQAGAPQLVTGLLLAFVAFVSLMAVFPTGTVIRPEPKRVRSLRETAVRVMQSRRNMWRWNAQLLHSPTPI